MTENLDYLEELAVFWGASHNLPSSGGGGGRRMFGFRWNGGGISRCQRS